MMTNMSSMPMPSARKGRMPWMVVKGNPSAEDRPREVITPITTENIPATARYALGGNSIK